MSEALRLFLIEDEDGVAALVRRVLEKARCEVVRCRTGADALIVLSQTPFDLVLLDQRLPDMTGLDLLGRLAADGIVAPVLMVTARGDEHLATRVLQAGALDYIVKDAELRFLDDLPKRVRESVRRHRLEQTNRLLVQSLESAHDGVLITDLQGVILEANASLLQQSGYERDEVIGKTPRLFKSGAHPPEFYARMWQTILSRASWQGEVTNRRKDGTVREMSLAISPIVDAQGRLTHFVGIQRDITEHKQLERQLLQAQKMQSIGTLAGGVAHEFNNLLAGINGYASLGLRESDAPPTLREFFQNIVDLSERAAGLTRQLLAFARKPALQRQPISLPDLVRETAELVGRTLHREVRVESSPEPTEPRLVQADRNQLQQALVNLAVNARDSILEKGQGGAITFECRHERLESPRPAFPQPIPPGDWMVAAVRDEGRGMPPSVMQQALDPFFTTKEVGQGTGLGLPVVFGIVQGHQGHLGIESEPGRGSRMALWLPRLSEARVPPPAPVLMDDAVLMEPEPMPGRSIVVVDDEESVLDVVRRFLEIAGHTASCFGSGASLLRVLDGMGPVDLVVLDLTMPDEDAMQVFEAIRAKRPGVPVLLCTGRAEADLAPRLLRQERTGLLRKPFRMTELWNAVGQAMEE
ncbi:MAG: response regulator [Gemmataceae bacterium]|nr:response regulator [Gemmataceae bacterium]